MPKTKGAQLTVDKWQRRSSVAQPEYLAGVQNPRVPWAEAAAAGEDNYKTAVVQAANAGAFSKGIRRVGNERWAKQAAAKGPARFVEGVQLSGPEFQERIGQVLSTIEAVTLPKRFPKGSPQNYMRVQPIGEALRRAFGKTGAK